MIKFMDPNIYFYLLMCYGFSNFDLSNDTKIHKPYVPYTTSIIITNSDMYNVDEIVDQCFFNTK